MAILAAFNSPDIQVLGLTSMYGNVPTPMATRNALTLCALAGRTDVSSQRREPAAGGRRRRGWGMLEGMACAALLLLSCLTSCQECWR